MKIVLIISFLVVFEKSSPPSTIMYFPNFRSYVKALFNSIGLNAVKRKI